MVERTVLTGPYILVMLLLLLLSLHRVYILGTNRVKLSVLIGSIVLACYESLEVSRVVRTLGGIDG